MSGTIQQRSFVEFDVRNEISAVETLNMLEKAPCEHDRSIGGFYVEIVQNVQRVSSKR